LQGFSSDHVLQIPITGLLNSSCGHPWFFIQLRCENPSRSFLPYHARLRKLLIQSSPFLDSNDGLVFKLRSVSAAVDYWKHHAGAIF
jgi:hypothetical protein